MVWMVSRYGYGRPPYCIILEIIGLKMIETDSMDAHPALRLPWAVSDEDFLIAEMISRL